MNIPVIVSDRCLRKHRYNEHRLSVLQPVKLNTPNPNNTTSSLLRCYVINARSLQNNNALQLLHTELCAVDGDVASCNGDVAQQESQFCSHQLPWL